VVIRTPDYTLNQRITNMFCDYTSINFIAKKDPSRSWPQNKHLFHQGTNLCAEAPGSRFTTQKAPVMPQREMKESGQKKK
jgi:hypothetical protein